MVLLLGAKYEYLVQKDVLAEGAYGSVRVAKCSTTGEVYACKALLDKSTDSFRKLKHVSPVLRPR